MRKSAPRAGAVRARRTIPALRAGLIATVLTTAGLWASGKPAAAAFPGTNGRITWSRIVGNGADVMVMNSDGSGVTNLTNSPWNEIWAAWSPDGSRIAFASDRDGNYDIYVMNANGTGLTRLTDNKADDSQPAWSPDGSKIAFNSLRDGNFDLYVMNADGSDQKRLTTSAGNDLEPAWSLDGRKIAFTSDRDLNFEVYMMNADGSGQTNLSNNPAADTEPAWSPNGARLVFVSNRGGNGDIWVMNSDGSAPTPLTTNPLTDLGPAWSADGGQITFTALRDGQDEIYVMDADGSDQVRLTHNITSDFLPDWQALGVRQAAPLTARALPPPAPIAPLPTVSINDTAFIEGAAAVFAVTLSAPSRRTVTVFYLTNDGTQQQCAPFGCAEATRDYVPRSGALIFKPGELVKTIVVPLPFDAFTEPNEVFVAVLTVPLHATASKGLGAGKITNQSLPYQAAQCVTEFSEGFTGHGGGLVLGPDNAFWTTMQFDAKLGRFDPRTLRATEYSLPAGVFPHFIMIGPDGNLWFTDLFDRIGKFEIATKTATMYPGMTPGAVPHFLMTGPDGNLWFAQQFEERIPEPGGQNRTRRGQSQIATFNLQTQQFTEYSEGLPPGTRLHGLAVGPDNHIWGTLESTSQIVRFNMDTKRFDKFVDFSPNSGPHDVILGPDDNLYVVLTDNGKIGRYNVTTGEIKEFDIPGLSPQDGNSLVFLTIGPDPRFLWFSEFLNDRIGRLNIVTGEVTEFNCGITPNSAPIGIVVGPDNNIWFSAPVLDTRFPGRMGRLVIADADKFTNPHRAYVGRLYRELLGREVDPSGLNYFAGLLEQGRANRFQVAASLLTSREARIQIALRVYLSFLGRGPTQPELAEALTLLDQPGGLNQLEVNVVTSQEYYQLRGLGTDEGFLASLYHDLLGRSPTSGDQFVFTRAVTRVRNPFDYALDATSRAGSPPLPGVPGQLDLKGTPEQMPRTFARAAEVLRGSRTTTGGSTLEQLRQQLVVGVPRAAVAGQLLGSQERIRRLVQGLHGRFLSRSAPFPVMNLYAEALAQGLTGDAMVADIVASSDYLGLGEKPRQ